MQSHAALKPDWAIGWGNRLSQGVCLGMILIILECEEINKALLHQSVMSLGISFIANAN